MDPDTSRLVRELLYANTRLADQVVELARFAIGAPSTADMPRARMDVVEQLPAPQGFAITSADDWPDIPDRPLAPDTQLPQGIEIPRRPSALTLVPDLPLSMSEEEEDMRYSVGMGLTEPKALRDLLEALGAPSPDIDISPLA